MNEVLPHEEQLPVLIALRGHSGTQALIITFGPHACLTGVCIIVFILQVRAL